MLRSITRIVRLNKGAAEVYVKWEDDEFVARGVYFGEEEQLCVRLE